MQVRHPGQYQGIQETSIMLIIASEWKEIFVLKFNIFVPYPLFVTTLQHATHSNKKEGDSNKGPKRILSSSA